MIQKARLLKRDNLTKNSLEGISIRLIHIRKATRGDSRHAWDKGYHAWRKWYFQRISEFSCPTLINLHNNHVSIYVSHMSVSHKRANDGIDHSGAPLFQGGRRVGCTNQSRKSENYWNILEVNWGALPVIVNDDGIWLT